MDDWSATIKYTKNLPNYRLIETIALSLLAAQTFYILYLCSYQYLSVTAFCFMF